MAVVARIALPFVALLAPSFITWVGASRKARSEVESSKYFYAPVSSFDEFREVYGRSYDRHAAEYAVRERHFQQRLGEVRRQNSRPAAERLWTAGINWMADYTKDEMDDLKGLYREIRHGQSTGSFLEKEGDIHKKVARSAATDEELEALPDEYSWDGLWTTKAENVRHQSCGNCWAMSTTAMLEAHNEIYMGFTRHFSYEEVTQCAPNPWECGGTGRCGGSIPELALLHIQANGLVSRDLEPSPCPNDMKPYWSENEPAPHELRSGVFMSDSVSPARSIGLFGWERLPENRLETLKRALVARGPTTVGVSTDWMGYQSGIFDGCNKDAVLEHSMMLLGFGRDDSIGEGGTKYWHLQNSWGSEWGENGKIRIMRRDDVEEQSWCGTNSNPAVGSGCRDGPAQVTTCGACGILYHSTVAYFPLREKSRKEHMRRFMGRVAVSQLLVENSTEFVDDDDEDEDD